MNRRIVMSFLLAALVVAVTPVMATAPEVATVPWNPEPDPITGNAIYTYPHTTYNGHNMLLMGVASDHDGDAALASYEWNFGDGSPTTSGALSGAGPVNIEAYHTYSGISDGTPLTATLTVCDVNSDCTTDNFYVVMKAMTLDVEVNIAIDRGLWYLHKQMYKSTDSATGEPLGRWYSSWGGSYYAGATSSVVQAYLINEHLTPDAGGNPAEDPYIDTVQRGINQMLKYLYRQNTSNQYCAATGSFNPDSDGNGYSLGTNSSRSQYEHGQIMDALAATRTPGSTALVGVTEVLGKTYSQIATDMGDYYAYCMDDSGYGMGAWRYYCNYSSSDNSAAQWGAIGFMGIEQAFGIPTDPCVKSQNLIWLSNSCYATGGCGYTGLGAGWATTAGGMCQFAMNDVTTDDSRWVAHEKWYCDRWSSFLSQNNFYSFYALAKAMRFAGNSDGTTGDKFLGDDATNQCSSPVEWYGDPSIGLARYLVDRQYTDGHWYSSSWVQNHLSTAWAIIILKPTLVCPVPVAVCNADPETSVVDCPVEFDGSDSTHPGASNPLPGCGTEIVGYEWDFDDGWTDSGDMVVHTFNANGLYNVTLTVTDNIGTESFTTCPVSVEPPPVAPDSNPNGPYGHCIGGGKLILDGSASRDPDNSPCVPGNGMVDWAWELDTAEFPYDFDDAYGEMVDATAYFEGLGVGVYNVGLRVTDDEGETGDDWTTVSIYDDPINCPCTPDPLSQGYWHRQCLGVPAAEGGIDPGRNGRGPSEPTEPNFVEELMPAIDARLEDLGFYGLTTCEGMDADPASDPCEKALKQYTAMLLNIESDRLQDLCGLDLSEQGCASTNVGDLVNEIADLINGGYCNTAQSCAAAVNEGDALTGGSETAGEVEAGLTTAVDSSDGSPGSFGAKSGATTGTQQTASATEEADTIDFRRLPGRRIVIPTIPLRSGAGVGEFILYYNVPRGYKSDDPRVVIMSYADDEVPEELDRERPAGGTTVDDDVKKPRLQKRRTRK